MKSYQVKDLMVPLSEYATVPEAATLLEVVKTLKKAQDEFGRNRYQHRAILVFDGNNHFVGKLSQHDVIEALEPKYKRMGVPQVMESCTASATATTSSNRIWSNITCGKKPLRTCAKRQFT
jgi:CBS domain containing-hemolysin-like protein